MAKEPTQIHNINSTGIIEVYDSRRLIGKNRQTLMFIGGNIRSKPLTIDEKVQLALDKHPALHESGCNHAMHNSEVYIVGHKEHSTDEKEIFLLRLGPKSSSSETLVERTSEDAIAHFIPVYCNDPLDPKKTHVVVLAYGTGDNLNHRRFDDGIVQIGSDDKLIRCDGIEGYLIKRDCFFGQKPMGESEFGRLAALCNNGYPAPSNRLKQNIRDLESYNKAIDNRENIVALLDVDNRVVKVERTYAP